MSVNINVLTFNHLYEELIEPTNFIHEIEDFDSWLNLGSKEDLIGCLEAFKKADMFEECILIQKK